MNTLLKTIGAACLAASAFAALRPHAGPDHVDITWMSITNMYYELGPLRIVTDGYFTRLPETLFYGGGGNVDSTHEAATPDVAAVRRVFTALGGRPAVNLLLTGHSHFDHSFDTPTWAKLSGARIIGSRTTCFQAIASAVPVNQCLVVDGGEKLPLSDGVTMYVVRWNHSGDPVRNALQHNPAELAQPPKPDSRTGGFRAGVAEDYPNGGGNRGYLFVVDGPDGRFSWFFHNSASAADLDVPIVLDGKNYGAPIENLKAAMKAAGLTSVDLWIGTGGTRADVARLVVPVLAPKAFLPVHWDGLYGAFEAGVTRPYADTALAGFLSAAHVQVVTPLQYMDKWRLDRSGIRPIANDDVKKALGFSSR